jgi:hypothetical protein
MRPGHRYRISNTSFLEAPMTDTDTIRIILAQPWFAVVAGAFSSAVLAIALVLSRDAIERFLRRR